MEEGWFLADFEETWEREPTLAPNSTFQNSPVTLLLETPKEVNLPSEFNQVMHWYSDLIFLV